MGRSPCCEKVGLKRGRWTAEEDHILRRYILANGEGSWRSLPKNAGLMRCGKSCRLRWMNYLRSDLKRGNFSAQEEELIVKLQSSLGTRWCLIAAHLPGRTDNEIKNYWNSHLSRKIHNFRRLVGSREPVSPSMADDVKAELLNKRKGYQSSKSAMNKTKSLKLPPSSSDQFIKKSDSSINLADKQTLPGVILPSEQENLQNHEPSEIEKGTVLESAHVVSQNLNDLIMETISFSENYGEIMGENNNIIPNEELSYNLNGISPFARNLDVFIDNDISALSEEPDAARWGLWKEEDLIGDWWEGSSPAKPDLKEAAELNWENVQLDANVGKGNEFPWFWDTSGFGEADVNDMVFGINTAEQIGAVLASLLE